MATVDGIKFAEITMKFFVQGKATCVHVVRSIPSVGSSMETMRDGTTALEAFDHACEFIRAYVVDQGEVKDHVRETITFQPIGEHYMGDPNPNQTSASVSYYEAMLERERESHRRLAAAHRDLVEYLGKVDLVRPIIHVFPSGTLSPERLAQLREMGEVRGDVPPEAKGY